MMWPPAELTPLRFRNIALIAIAFAGPCLIGAPVPYLLFLLVIAGYLTPSIYHSFRQRTHNPVDLMLVLPALAIMLTFAVTADEPRDLLYMANFLPLLLVVPFRWQLESDARRDGLAILSSLALAGSAFALLVGLIQVFGFGIARAGGEWLNAIQFADSAMLLGFLALAGAWVPGTKYRWVYLLGPLFGIAATVLAGTRGAMLAIPLLGMLAIVFAVLGARDRRKAVAGAVAVAAAVVLIAVLPLLYAALTPNASPLEKQLARSSSVIQAIDDAAKLGKNEHSTHVRVEFAMAGAKAFAAAPVFGYGWSNMVEAVVPYAPEDFRDELAGYGHLHNDFLNAALSAGLIGIVSYIALLLAPLIGVLYTPRDTQYSGRLYMALALSSGYAVFGLTNVMFGYEFHTTLFGFLLIPIISFCRDPVLRPAADSEDSGSQRATIEHGPRSPTPAA